MSAALPTRPAPTLHLGDCVAWLRSLPEASVDAIVCDPPYGLGKPPPVEDVLRAWLDGVAYVPRSSSGFMGKSWDAFVPGPEVWRECFRVLKPGGHLVAFAGDRTVDWMGLAIRFAGFEYRRTLGWVTYSGFPKALDVSRALDAAAGAEREVVGTKLGLPGYSLATSKGANLYGGGIGGTGDPERECAITAPATDLARQWSGWATDLKPAIEPAVLARKPLEGTVAANVAKWGTGALNIDGCRLAPGDPAWVGPDDGETPTQHGAAGGANGLLGSSTFQIRHRDPGQSSGQTLGRWPANLYYCPKAPRAERERGCDGLPARAGHEAVDREEGSAGTRSPRAGAGRNAALVRNTHPCVKPARIMRWLCRLVTPPGGLVVDPFTGSGTTGVAAALEGFRFAGAEREPEYHAIASARMAHAARWPESWADTAPGAVEAAEDWTERVERNGQERLFGGAR